MFRYFYEINVVCFATKMPVLSKYIFKRECIFQKRRKIRLMMMHFIMIMEDPVREVWIHPLNVERFTKGEFYRLYLDQRYFPNSLRITICLQFNLMIY